MTLQPHFLSFANSNQLMSVQKEEEPIKLLNSQSNFCWPAKAKVIVNFRLTNNFSQQWYGFNHVQVAYLLPFIVGDSPCHLFLALETARRFRWRFGPALLVLAWIS